MSNLNYYDFMKVDIRVGTIVKAEEYNMLKKPSIILDIYFGNKIGIKKSFSKRKSLKVC